MAEDEEMVAPLVYVRVGEGPVMAARDRTSMGYVPEADVEVEVSTLLDLGCDHVAMSVAVRSGLWLPLLLSVDAVEDLAQRLTAAAEQVRAGSIET